MPVGIIGKKIGMTTMYDANGLSVACTIIKAGPCVVTQVRTEEVDGYTAVQLGFGERKNKHTSKAMQGHFQKSGSTPKRKLLEFRDFAEQYGKDINLGDELKLSDIFDEGDYVDVVGKSKGKGFQGVVKRYNFQGVNDATHGQHNRQRHPGSIGAASYPARVFKGMRMGGRMGNQRVKLQNLQIIKIIEEENLVIVSGSTPGAKQSYVILEK